ncbi:MAG TPA: GNAT family N-acetyltransferase, partial [Actinomycetales bacterium]|nr:GNAT family N-acetyltransferase [Actinomycetales bacterium]
ATISVRQARPEELTAAGAVVAQAYLVDGHDEESYLPVLADAASRAEDGEVLVAVDGAGEVLGSVTFATPPSPLAELARIDEAEFRMLGVSPTARGRGVGTALVQACLDRAKALGKSGIVISTEPDMRAAHRIYERFGFVRDPERDWRPLPDVPLLAYQLRF